MKQASLKKVLNVSLILSILTAAAIVSISSRELGRRLESQFATEANERAELIGKLILNSLLLSDYQEVQSTAESLLQHPQVLSVAVRDTFGQLIVDQRAERDTSKGFRTVIPLINDRNGAEMGSLEIHQSYEFVGNLVVSWFIGILVSIFLLGLVLFSIYFWASRSVVDFFKEVSVQFLRLSRDETALMEDRWRFKELSDLCKKFNDLSSQISSMRKTEKDQAKLVALAEVASQVAHDIRSPVTAIRVIATSVQGLSGTERSVIREAAERINGIAEELLQKRRQWTTSSATGSGEALTPVNLLPVLADLIDEKRFEVSRRKGSVLCLDAQRGMHDAFCRANADQLKRIFSNLINNGFEAMEWEGTLDVRFFREGAVAIVEFEDRGTGIAADVIPKLLMRGNTFGKKQGTGLGLAMSHETITSYGGTINVRSELGRGTVVSVRIPLCETPEWYVPELTIHKNEEVVILDDDLSVHQAWMMKFKSLGTQEQVHSFSSEVELARWLDKSRNPHRLYLVDYELAAHGAPNGLDVMERLKLTTNGILVTGRYCEPKVIEKCQRMGVRLLPKSLMHDLPVRLV